MTIEVPTIALFVALMVPLGAIYWWAVNKYWYPWTDRKLNAWLERKIQEIESRNDITEEGSPDPQ